MKDILHKEVVSERMALKELTLLLGALWYWTITNGLGEEHNFSQAFKSLSNLKYLFKFNRCSKSLLYALK